MTPRSLFRSPVFHLSLLTGAILIAFAHTHIHPMDDHGRYQLFIETLATGQVDLSIPGFHGASFLALPLYIITRSDLTNIHFQILCATLLVPLMYLAVFSLFREKFLALVAAYAMAMMPFFMFLSFRGFTFSSYTLFVLLAIWLYGRGSRMAWLPLGIAIVIKPFAIALFPLLLLWKPEQQSDSQWRRGRMQVLLACIIPGLYVIAQILQVGHIITAASGNFDQSNVFLFSRLPLNAAHGVQILFSIHNFYFLEPALTRMSNMVHTSPLFMVFGLFTLLSPREFFSDRRPALGLAASFIAAYLLASSLDHMDNLYLQTSVLMLLFASLPFFKKYPLWIPVVLATLHFQWLYAYLELREVFQLNYWFFTPAVAVDLLFLMWCFVELDFVRKQITDLVRVYRAA
jgi:hypothetical protein